LAQESYTADQPTIEIENFSEDEIGVLNSTKNGKAGEIDNILPEFIKRLNPAGQQWLPGL